MSSIKLMSQVAKNFKLH